jgi:hypothetical protein
MSVMRPRRALFLTLGTAVLLGLVACASSTPAGGPEGGSSSAPTHAATTAPTAASAYQLMRQSGASATSVHVRGDYTDKGQPLQLDVAGDRAGMTMRLLVDFGSGGIEILKVNGDFYLKAGMTFWTRLESAEVARVAAGRYVKVPPGSAAGMGDFRVGILLDQVFAERLPGLGELNATVQTSDVDGVPAYLMTSKVAGAAKVYVSADGQGRLLRTEGARSGTLSFTQWSSVVPVTAPAQDQRAVLPNVQPL